MTSRSARLSRTSRRVMVRLGFVGQEFSCEGAKARRKSKSIPSCLLRGSAPWRENSCRSSLWERCLCPKWCGLFLETDPARDDRPKTGVSGWGVDTLGLQRIPVTLFLLRLWERVFGRLRGIWIGAFGQGAFQPIGQPASTERSPTRHRSCRDLADRPERQDLEAGS